MGDDQLHARNLELNNQVTSMARRRIRVGNPKVIVVRLRLSRQTYEALKETSARKTRGKVSPLIRHYVLEGLKKDGRKCPTVENK